MHSATLVADGGSSDRWKPATQREWDVDRERQPWPLDRLARDAVDHDHIDQRMVDLDQRQRPGCIKRAGCRAEPVAGRLAAAPPGVT